jgi:hypothetical protein
MLQGSADFRLDNPEVARYQINRSEVKTCLTQRRFPALQRQYGSEGMCTASELDIKSQPTAYYLCNGEQSLIIKPRLSYYRIGVVKQSGLF